jgi:hypothetical protein
MKLSSSILVLALAVTAGNSFAAMDRTLAVDYTQGNARFAPPATSQRPQLDPVKLAPTPQSAEIHLERRSFTATPAAKSKTLRPTAVVRKQKRLSPGLHRPKARATSAGQLAYPDRSHVVSPPVRRVGRVGRYQNQLSSTDAVYVGRTPTLDRSGTARLNRFLFRRSAPPTEVVTPRVVRAGAGAAVQR